MAASSSPYTLDTSHVQWDASGNPYYGTSTGKPYYIPPITAAQSDDQGADGQRLRQWAQSHGASPTTSGAPSASYLQTRGTWNPDTGTYDQNVNWSNLLSTGIAAGLGAGAISAASGGGAASAAGDVGTTGSTVPITGTLPAVAASGAVPAALAGGAGAAAPNLFHLVQGLAGVAAPIVGAVVQSNAANDAANAQLQATREALAQQQAQYAQTRTDLGPYRDLGSGAGNKLKFLMGIS